MSQPINLNLASLRYPIPAIVSICHRISGVVLLFGVGYMTWLLTTALGSESGFQWVAGAMNTWVHGTLIWIVLVAVSYHFLAGVRHLLLDLHIGESLKASRISAWTVMALSSVVAVLLAGWMLFN